MNGILLRDEGTEVKYFRNTLTRLVVANFPHCTIHDVFSSFFAEHNIYNHFCVHFPCWHGLYSLFQCHFLCRFCTSQDLLEGQGIAHTCQFFWHGFSDWRVASYHQSLHKVDWVIFIMAPTLERLLPH